MKKISKKLILLTIIFAVLFSAIGTSVYAKTNNKGVTVKDLNYTKKWWYYTTAGCNIYSLPNDIDTEPNEDAEVIGSYKRNEVFKTLGYYEPGNWHKVNYKGKTGYVNGEDIMYIIQTVSTRGKYDDDAYGYLHSWHCGSISDFDIFIQMTYNYYSENGIKEILKEGCCVKYVDELKSWGLLSKSYKCNPYKYKKISMTVYTNQETWGKMGPTDDSVRYFKIKKGTSLKVVKHVQLLLGTSLRPLTKMDTKNMYG